MTPELKARIEKAAERAWDTGLDASTGDVGLIVRAAFPELFTDPPSHWIAPMDPSTEVHIAAMERYARWLAAESLAIAKAIDTSAYSDVDKAQCKGWHQGFCSWSGDQSRQVWDAMRTAYLNQKDSEG